MSTDHVGFEGRVVSPLKQFPPIDLVEKWVGLDLGWAFGPKSMIRSAVKELDQEVFGRQRHDLRPRKMQRFG